MQSKNRTTEILVFIQLWKTLDCLQDECRCMWTVLNEVGFNIALQLTVLNMILKLGWKWQRIDIDILLALKHVGDNVIVSEHDPLG